MGQIKKFYFDLETTGVDAFRNAIHQIAAIIEIDGKVKDTINWNIKPFAGAVIEKEALEVGGVTEDQLKEYPEASVVYKRLLRLLGKYVNKFDKKDKFHLIGFNNRYFDDRFLRSFFEHSGDFYFGSWFWADSLDVMVLASQRLIYERSQMKNFKLGTVAETLGVKVDESKLHDGLYDVQLTKSIYDKITGFDLM